MSDLGCEGVAQSLIGRCVLSRPAKPTAVHRPPLVVVVLLSLPSFARTQTVTGPLTEWQTLTLDFSGPAASEAGGQSNPFLDWRLNVTFTHADSGTTYHVPGYFAGDGEGGGTGSVWRTRFTPDDAGDWTYDVSFRNGANVAVSLDPMSGVADPLIDGRQGTLQVGTRDTHASGFLKWGRLEYDKDGTSTSQHYLKFRDGGYWLKGGVDSPENLLGYRDFDNTPNYRHTYEEHESDWRPGDPTWNGGRGKGLIGALNYLASQHVNSIYFLPMNIGGDGKDTWPYVGPVDRSGSPSNDNKHFDVSKLRQWETVFEHAQKKGIHLHFVFNEAESPNKRELDNGELGLERKLFYREMIARFGHHNAVQWNISEEYNIKFDLGPTRVKQFAQYIREVDPYDHPITVHNAGTPINSWGPFFGDDRFDVTSIQRGISDGLEEQVELLREQSALKGRPIPIMIDEPMSLHLLSADEVRKRMLWDIYFSGGGVEWIVADQDKKLEDFREYEQVWRDTWRARQFMEENLPFWEMSPNDRLLARETDTFGGGEVFAISGQLYAIYLPSALETGILDVRGVDGEFLLRWYNPRTGQFEGHESRHTGDIFIELGPPPSSPTEDWVALVTVVPEPSSFVLLCFAALFLFARRTRKE